MSDERGGASNATGAPGFPLIAAPGLVVRCDLRGEILEVVQNNCGILQDRLVGKPLTRIVDHGSTTKAAAFVRAIVRDGAAFDWELGCWDGTRVQTLTFAGVRCTDEAVIIGATSMGALTACLEQLTAVNNEQANELRRLLKARPTPETNARDYEELTRLNNEHANLQRELNKANADLERLARTDALTGVPNRRDFFERAEAAFRRAAHEDRPAAVLMCDADGFKACNDRYGHAVGDRVLIELSRRLAEQMRPGDCFGRYGGEEFAAFLPGCDATSAMRIAERLRATVAASPLSTSEDGEQIRLTVSLGVATLSGAAPGEEHPTLDQLLDRADRAVYRAKDLGRNRVELCSDDEQDRRVA